MIVFLLALWWTEHTKHRRVFDRNSHFQISPTHTENLVSENHETYGPTWTLLKPNAKLINDTQHSIKTYFFCSLSLMFSVPVLHDCMFKRSESCWGQVKHMGSLAGDEVNHSISTSLIQTRYLYSMSSVGLDTLTSPVSKLEGWLFTAVCSTSSP